MDKIEKIQRWLSDNNRDIALISDPKTIQYLSGFYSDPNERVLLLVVFKNSDPFLFGPALETQAIKESGWSNPVYGYLDHEKPWEMIADQFMPAIQPKQILQLKRLICLLNGLNW